MLMKNPGTFIFALLFTFLVALVIFGQDPVKPAEQQPTQQPPKKPEPEQKKEAEPEQQPEIIKLDTTLVTVPVIITDGFGRFINGLKIKDFTLHEDGDEQIISDFSDASTPFNVALLIDVSLSTKNKLDEIKRTAKDFVKLLQPRDKVLVVAFDDQVRFVGDFTGDQKVLETNIKKLKTGYRTRLYDAIALTITEKFNKLPGRKAIVVLSDGVDSGSKIATSESVLEMLARNSVIAYSVRYETRNDGSKILKPRDLPDISPSQFMGHHWQAQPRGMYEKQRPKDRDMIGIEFLQEMANRSGAIYIRSESIQMTAYALAQIADELRNQYTLAYDPKNKKDDGGFRRITVNLKQNNFRIRAREGYFAPKPTVSKEPVKPANNPR